MDCYGRLNRRQFIAAVGGGTAALTLGGAISAKANPIEQTHPTGPLAMWALTGMLGSDDVRRQLDAYSQVGWGVVLYPRWGLEIEYLSAEWFSRIRFIVEEAAARRMEVWLYDEFTWPSGHAKGLVVADHPELEAQLLYVEKDGSRRIESVTGSANLLMPEATQRFLEITHEQYAKTLNEFMGTTVRAIFTDEPSLAKQHQRRATDDTAWRFAWSPVMEQALGGDFFARVAAADDLENWTGWQEYWAAYAQIFHDAWAAPIADWCKAHNILMTGHFLGEGSFGTQVAYNGSLRVQQRTLGLPGIDEISTRTEVEKCEALTLASMSELEGCERMVEVFALGPPSMKLDTMLKMVDICASCGIDRYVMAICPFDLRGGMVKREYLGIHGPQQPWFREYAGLFAEYVAEAAVRAHKAKPLGVPWPTDEELWAMAGPDPVKSEKLKTLTNTFVAEAREAIRSRLQPEPAMGAVTTPADIKNAAWTFAPVGLNTIRLDEKTLTIMQRPNRAELSVQTQLVQRLCINGTLVDINAASADDKFDLSYQRVTITDLLQEGENIFDAELTESKPLVFLPALILWGDFAIDSEKRWIKQSETIALGDWRPQGFPALCGTGRYRTEVEFSSPPETLILDTGGWPARVIVNGRDLGHKIAPPMQFDAHGAIQSGRNEIIVEVTSTVGHLFDSAKAPAVGLFAISCKT